MRIGIVTTEFPPAVGGMEEHAGQLADTIAASDEITVFTTRQHAGFQYDEKYPVKPILTGQQTHDAPLLTDEQPDAWLILNAGYAWLATRVKQPVFAYCHGNDFIRPWLDNLTGPGRVLTDTLGHLPYIWRFEKRARAGLRRRVIGAGLAACKVVFVNSHYTREMLTRTYPQLTTPTKIVTPGVSSLFFDTPHHSRPNSGATLKLLTVARLSSGASMKNVDQVLRALALIKNDIAFSYTIAGDGDARPALENLAADLSISERTEFLGTIGRAQVIAELDKADLFVLPSFESFGIVYAEAATRGVPSLALGAGGATEVVDDGVTGIVLAEATPHHIANGVRQFESARGQFNTEAIRRASDKFRYPAICDRIMSTIHND